MAQKPPKSHVLPAEGLLMEKSQGRSIAYDQPFNPAKLRLPSNILPHLVVDE